jgi:hypothetical protein
MTTREQIIRYAERALDRALDEAAMAGACIRFAEAGEIELANRARRILEVETRRARR